MIKSFGAYVGIGVDPKVDHDAVAQKLADAGYDKVSIFLTTAFGNTGLWPWPLVAGKFDYSRINQVWLNNLTKMCMAYAVRNINPHFCFVDQFHSKEDNPGPDPFRQGLGMGNDWDEEPLYSSWDGKDYRWLKWDSDRDPKPYGLSQFSLVGPFGQGMQRFIKAVIGVCKKTRLKYKIRPSWKWSNETMATAVLSAGKWKTTNKRGDRDEVFIWVKGLWIQAGFIEGMTMDSYFDYLCVTAGKHKSDPDYICMPVMKTAFNEGVRRKHNANLEVHGILTVSDCRDYQMAGLDPKYMLFSTDGDLGMKAQYSALGHSAFNTDLKFDVRAGQPWDPKDWMLNFTRYFPPYSKYIKGAV